VIVAPNVLTKEGDACYFRITTLEQLSMDQGGATETRKPVREVIVTNRAIPRSEMRTFLSMCEKRCVVTGDQSLAEAVVMGMEPRCIPDAKVEQWNRAVSILRSNAMHKVPDLGDVLSQLINNITLAQHFLNNSVQHCQALQQKLDRDLGPQQHLPANATLVMAGFFG